MKKTRILFICIGFLLFSGCSSINTTSESPLTPINEEESTISQANEKELILRDIEFIPGGGAFQSLDVYLPSNNIGPFPTILAIHGGPFKARSKGIYSQIASHYNDQGYAFVSTNYRFSTNASYPAQVEDVFCSLAWIYANHDSYGFDTNNIFVTGGSSGGYLAAMIGTVDDPNVYLENCPHSLPGENWVQGMVILYGFYDFTDPTGWTKGKVEGMLEPYWGAKYSDLSSEMLAEMSPQSWVNGNEPPTIIIHGTLDTIIPSWKSEKFAAELENAGVDVELLLIDAKHAFELKPLTSPENVQSFAAIDAFILKHLDN